MHFGNVFVTQCENYGIYSTFKKWARDNCTYTVLFSTIYNWCFHGIFAIKWWELIPEIFTVCLLKFEFEIEIRNLIEIPMSEVRIWP